MLIVPGFAETKVNNFYDLLKLNYSMGIGGIFSQLFVLTTGDIFINLVIQAGGGAFINQLNSLGPIFNHYLSPIITLKSQRFLYENASWSKDDGSIYDYGYFYAQITVIVGIAAAFQYGLLGNHQLVDSLHSSCGHILSDLQTDWRCLSVAGMAQPRNRKCWHSGTTILIIVD